MASSDEGAYRERFNRAKRFGARLIPASASLPKLFLVLAVLAGPWRVVADEAGDDGLTLPATMTHESVIGFLLEHDITTVESFIDFLPSLHKRQYATVYESQSPTAEFIGPAHPRVVSWGADARFIVTWTTHPDLPQSDQVEFLQAEPEQARWAAGVIDFSSDSPEVMFPPTCARCHGDPIRPLWGSHNVFEGTEFPHPASDGRGMSADEQVLYETMAASNHPRLEPLERGEYEPRNLVNGFRKIPVGPRGNLLSPNWHFSDNLALRHAEVLFNRLKSLEDYDRVARGLVCHPVEHYGTSVAIAEVIPIEQTALHLLSETLDAVQGTHANFVYAPNEYRGGIVFLSASTLFLVLTMRTCASTLLPNCTDRRRSKISLNRRVFPYGPS